MPSKHAKPDSLLEEALEALSDGLTACGAPWMVIGGIAVIARGVRRFTTDIDAAVRSDAVSVQSVLKTLAEFDVRPRIEDPQAFAEANLALYPDIDRARVRRRVAELSELADAPEILTALDDLLARTSD